MDLMAIGLVIMGGAAATAWSAVCFPFEASQRANNIAFAAILISGVGFVIFITGAVRAISAG